MCINICNLDDFSAVWLLHTTKHRYMNNKTVHLIIEIITTLHQSILGAHIYENIYIMNVY